VKKAKSREKNNVGGKCREGFEKSQYLKGCGQKKVTKQTNVGGSVGHLCFLNPALVLSRGGGKQRRGLVKGGGGI